MQKIKNYKKRLTNLAIGWIDYKIVYNMFPQVWTTKSLMMFGVASNITDFIENTMGKGIMMLWKQDTKN